MSRSFYLGNAFGVSLFVHPTFFLLPALILALNWSAGLLAVLFSLLLLFTVFACVVLHELGHALMGRVFGIITQDVTLYPIGGVARMSSTGNRPFEEICIALAGPAVNLFLVVVLSPLVALLAMSGLPLKPDLALESGPAAVFASFVATVWLANGILLLFNLLPVFPMDGGRVLRAALSVGLGSLRATEIAAAIGMILALGLCFVGVMLGNLSLILVPMFVIFAGQMELAAIRRREARARLIPVERMVSSLNQFTGFVWDRDRQVWVRWIDGRPVDSW